MSKLRATIKVQLPVAAIGKLYARLDDEATPHELRVKKRYTRGRARDRDQLSNYSDRLF